MNQGEREPFQVLEEELSEAAAISVIVPWKEQGTSIGSFLATFLPMAIFLNIERTKADHS